jgi:hypothetical protein
MTAAPQFEGPLETHLTVAATVDPDALERFAQRHNLRFAHIVLPRGAHPSQPMLTRRARGTLAGELAHANRLAQTLRDAGFAVCRTKIEASPANADVPPFDAGDAGRYFESHIKLRLPTCSDLAALAAFATARQAHLSANARRVAAGGEQTRFVTQRVQGAGCLRAVAEADALAQALTELGYAVVGVETEYVVYDSNLAIDAGWIGED